MAGITVGPMDGHNIVAAPHVSGGTMNINFYPDQTVLQDKQVARCLADLFCTDPRDDKTRIEQTKGGLLEDSYRWILSNDDFLQWRHSESSLLWIKGDPGKGKTMLLCGIIDELCPATRLAGNDATTLLSYFFCQATDERINSATAVLRGLLYLLVDQQHSLFAHIPEKYKHQGRALFEDANAWSALSKILKSLLQDPTLPSTYILIDALDECVAKDLPWLLDWIVETASTSSRVKWIVSSRNLPNIEERLYTATQTVRLSLELNKESISAAVRIYIRNKIQQLAGRKNYSPETKEEILRYLSSNACDTFLWVALVCQRLAAVPLLKVLAALKSFPPGLDSLYQRMMDMLPPEDVDLCKEILAVVSCVYQPITVMELANLVTTLEDKPSDPAAWKEIIGLCGSFLTIRDHTIYFIHQSAQDFLLKKAFHQISSSTMEHRHHTIFSASLDAMSETLRRNIYGLHSPGFPVDRVQQPKKGPLAAVRYLCIHWIDHLRDSDPIRNTTDTLQDDGPVDRFLRRSSLHWLEALSLLKSMSHGLLSMAKLEGLLQEQTSQLARLVRDEHRFIQYYKQAIETSPLQEEPEWITTKPPVENNWNACRQTLEGHNASITSVAFSPDSRWLASASWDKTIKVWDPASGAYTQTLEGHNDGVKSVTFSPDSRWLASKSWDETIKVWDPASGACTQTLKGHNHYITSVAFSPNSRWLASVSCDETIKVWDPASGACTHTLDAGRVNYNLVFDLISSHLNLDLDPPLPATTQHHPEPSWLGYGLCHDGMWITWKTEKVLWLPPGYRPRMLSR